MQMLNSVKLQSKLSERRPGVLGGPVSIISCLFKKINLDIKIILIWVKKAIAKQPPSSVCLRPSASPLSCDSVQFC